VLALPLGIAERTLLPLLMAFYSLSFFLPTSISNPVTRILGFWNGAWAPKSQSHWDSTTQQWVPPFNWKIRILSPIYLTRWTIFLWFQNFAYDVSGIRGDVWRWFCRNMRLEILVCGDGGMRTSSSSSKKYIFKNCKIPTSCDIYWPNLYYAFDSFIFLLYSMHSILCMDLQSWKI
jgi:hypothetical protein